MGARNQIADMILDGKPYMLAPSKSGSRSWQEEGPAGAEIRDNLRDVARGNLENEIRINWNTKHRGYGEPVRRVEGRDYWGRNVDKRFPGQVTLSRVITTITPTQSASSDPAAIAVLGNNVYVAHGAYVLKINPATQTETSATSVTAATDLVYFQGKLFLARGNSNVFQYTSDGTTWTSHAALTALKFAPAINRLYRLAKGASVSVATFLTNNAVDATDNLNWSAEDAIGLDNQVPGTGMATLGYQIFIAKEDGLYAADIDTGRFLSLTPELAPWRSTTMGTAVKGWGGIAFFNTPRGLRGFYAGSLYSAGPEVMSANDSEVFGRITALAGDASWLYAALYNGTDTYILAGRNATSDDAYPGEIVWNVVWYIAGGPFTTMALVSTPTATEPQLILVKSNQVAFIKLGANSDNPLRDSTAVYATSGTDYYPAHDGGSPQVDKHFLELRVYCENLNRVAGREITWAYKLDDDTAWTTLGTAKDSPVSVLKFDQATVPVGKRISLKATYTRGSTTTASPVLRSVEVLAVEYPPTRKVLTVEIQAQDRVQLRVGTDTRNWDQIYTDLVNLGNAQRRVSLTDPAGREYTVLPMRPVFLQEVQVTDSRAYDATVLARFLVVD